MRYEKSCGGVIIINHQVLLIKNLRSAHWSFPKGHMERGETEIQTALREVKEETGLSVIITPSKFVKINYQPAEDIDKDVVYFLAHPYMGQVKAQVEEVSEIGWFTIEDALGIITFDQEKEVLISLLK